MGTTTAKKTSLLLDRDAKIAARKRVIGLWKDKYRDMIKENKKLRKEWSKRAKKIGW